MGRNEIYEKLGIVKSEDNTYMCNGFFFVDYNVLLIISMKEI